MYHAFPMDFLGRQQRESVLQIIDDLLPKQRGHARASAIRSPFAVLIDLSEEVEVFLFVAHCGCNCFACSSKRICIC